jgi:hypothetical protein
MDRMRPVFAGHPVPKNRAFTIEDENIRKQFEAEYSKTASLYYRGHILWTKSSPHSATSRSPLAFMPVRFARTT